MDPIFHKRDEIVEFSNDKAVAIAHEIDFACWVDNSEPDAAFESVTDTEFDKEHFDDFLAVYIANESISTQWGKLINFEKEIKMAGNAMAKEAGDEINLEPGTKGFTTSAPRKKDGQYYTRATLAFSDGQAVRILFYDPEKPSDKPKYPTNQVSFQIFLNKKDITSHLIKGGGKDYGPRKFGKIIGNLLKKNSAKFLAKNAQIKAQKDEMETIDKEMAELDKDILAKSNEAAQAKEKGVFLKKQHADLKKKSEEAVKAKKAKVAKVEAEKKQKAEIDNEADALKKEAYKLGKQAFQDGINKLPLDNLLLELKSRKELDSNLLDTINKEWQKGWESEKVKSEKEVDTGGEVQTTEPREDLKQLLIKEYGQLKSSGDVPTFELGIRVGKKKGNLAGKVTLDLKSADVLTLEDLDKLKLAINNIVSTHTDNYELNSDKAANLIEGKKSPDLKIGDKHTDQSGATETVTHIIDGVPMSVVNPTVTIKGGGGKKGPADYTINSMLKDGKWFGLSMIQKSKPSDNDLRKLIREALDYDQAVKDQAIVPPDDIEIPPEQIEDTGIKQSEPPPDEAPPNGREIGQDYKDRNDVTKSVTHKIDNKTVSAIEQRGYILSAYLRNGRWTNLPTESGTLISEDKLKTAIDRSETAYGTADDILTGKYDADGPDKVDQLLDEIAEVIEDDTTLMQVANYLTKLMKAKYQTVTPTDEL